MEELKEKEMRVSGLYEDASGHTLVVLKDDLGRSLPIWIGPCEAFAIELVLQKAEVPRPMSHDLMKMLIEKLEGKIVNILIDDLSNGVYYARINISLNGKPVSVDARPSDAIALALRAKCPIFVREAVIEAAMLEHREELEEDEE